MWVMPAAHTDTCLTGASVLHDRMLMLVGDSVRGNGSHQVLWYRKEFTLPSSWRAAEDDEVFLDFEGAFRRTIVWINGQKVLTHESGYASDPVALKNGPTIWAPESPAP
jgi:hypothetical protein